MMKAMESGRGTKKKHFHHVSQSNEHSRGGGGPIKWFDMSGPGHSSLKNSNDEHFDLVSGGRVRDAGGGDRGPPCRGSPAETATGTLYATLKICMATVLAASGVVPRTPDTSDNTSNAHRGQADLRREKCHSHWAHPNTAETGPENVPKTVPTCVG